MDVQLDNSHQLFRNWSKHFLSSEYHKGADVNKQAIVLDLGTEILTYVLHSNCERMSTIEKTPASHGWQKTDLPLYLLM
ncbi:hypothetical protein AV530_013382 [Patagioenas fasciata monilis]|uniref:Uncharacterized protein n=1 Tax=Patagioenas fasciata monilis TaxID=372326 RepID=A0A1V4JPE6_PATFA|nr:hypothetical protein AV530_013382 [Patagioenas fasciata monilis]